jgi:hypothetical protein
MTPAQWVLPVNHEAIAQTVVGGLPQGLSLATGAPLTTVADLLIRPESHETLVHFVNFDRHHPLAPFSTTVRAQFSGPVKSVTCLSPDHDEAQPLQFAEKDQHVTFTVPATKMNALIAIAQ